MLAFPMFCDYRGISTIATTDQYGDFNRGRLSWEAPWLWIACRSESPKRAVDKTVVAAPIRNKNQYRVFFKGRVDCHADHAGAGLV